MSVMKELSSRWFISAHDHIRANPDIVKNGFKKAGITNALEKGIRIHVDKNHINLLTGQIFENRINFSHAHNYTLTV